MTGMYFTKEHITRVRLFLSLCLVFLNPWSILLFCRPGVLAHRVNPGQLFQGGITLLFRLLFFCSLIHRLVHRPVWLEGAILLHLPLVVLLLKRLLHIVAHEELLLLLLLLCCYRLVVIILLLLLLLLLLLDVEGMHVVELCLHVRVHVCSLVLWWRVLLDETAWLIVVSGGKHLLMLVVHHDRLGGLLALLCHGRDNGDGWRDWVQEGGGLVVEGEGVLFGCGFVWLWLGLGHRFYFNVHIGRSLRCQIYLHHLFFLINIILVRNLLIHLLFLFLVLQLRQPLQPRHLCLLRHRLVLNCSRAGLLDDLFLLFNHFFWIRRMSRRLNQILCRLLDFLLQFELLLQLDLLTVFKHFCGFFLMLDQRFIG